MFLPPGVENGVQKTHRRGEWREKSRVELKPSGQASDAHAKNDPRDEREEKRGKRRKMYQHKLS